MAHWKAMVGLMEMGKELNSAYLELELSNSQKKNYGTLYL